jgi:hypothetical protein
MNLFVKIGFSLVLTSAPVIAGSGAKNSFFWSFEELVITDSNRLLTRWADNISSLAR